MSDYALSLLLLLGAMLAQAVVAGLATAMATRGTGRRLAWGAFAIAAIILALQHGHNLELAVTTGLYDFRQAILSAAVAVMLLATTFAFRRPA